MGERESVRKNHSRVCSSKANFRVVLSDLSHGGTLHSFRFLLAVRGWDGDKTGAKEIEKGEEH